MKCLHGEPAAHSTTQNGSFWFCNQSPSCHFFCPEDEGYLFEKAIESWKSTKQPHPRCDGHQKLARMRVVKNLLKPTYAYIRPFFVCSDKTNPCSYWVWGDVRPITKPECRHGSPCMIRKSRRKVSTRIVGSSAAQTIRRIRVDFSKGFLRSRPTHIIVV